MLNLIKIFKKTLSLVEIFENLDLGKKNSKNFDFGQYLWKSRVWSKLMKTLILVKIFENIDFGDNCPNISNMMKIIEKSRFW